MLTKYNENSSGDEIANVNFYEVHPEGTRMVPIESSYTIPISDYTNLPPRYFATPLVFNSPNGGVSLG